MLLSSSSRSSRNLMLNFSGNFISQLQSHVFLIPWVGKKVKMVRISCSKGRDYSTSGPIRYIPKTSSSGSRESEVSSELDDALLHRSVESDGKRAERWRREVGYMDRVLSINSVRKQYENPDSKISHNDGVGRRIIAQSSEYQSENGVGIGGFVQPNVSSDMCENPKSREDNDIRRGTGEYVQPGVDRIDSSKSSENIVFEAKDDERFGTSRVVRSDVRKIKHPKSKQSSSGGRSYVINTEGLGVDEEFEDDDMHSEDYVSMEESEVHSKEMSLEGRGGLGLKTKEDVQKMAVELLAARALTAMELRKKLQSKSFPLLVVDAVIQDFKGRGLINDGLYAESFSRSRWSSSTWGPRRIKKALYSKGVSELDADNAVKSVFNDASSSDEESESALGMSKLSMDRLLAQASKQWMKSSDVSIEKRKARMISWLQYRGFNWSIISVVLKKLDSKSST